MITNVLLPFYGSQCIKMLNMLDINYSELKCCVQAKSYEELLH